MKKLLLAIIFLLFSYIAFAPELSQLVREETQIKLKHELLIQALPSIAKLVSIETDIRDLPLSSPIDTAALKKVNSGFGLRLHPVLNRVLFHEGVDIDSPTGTAVLSTARGWVEEVKVSKFGYGNYVIINHGNGYKTRYAHLQAIAVQECDQVDVGQLIGLSGNTGLTTGPHLHYEIIKNNKPINPVKFITNNVKEYTKILKSIQRYETIAV